MAPLGRRSIGAASSALLLLGAANVVRRVDLALAGAHTPDTYSGGVGDLTSPMRAFTPKVSVDVAGGWSAYADTLVTEPVPARTVDALTLAYLGADIVLMVSLTALLLIVRSSLHSGTPESEGDGRAPAQDVLRLTRIPIYVYLASDLVETLLATLLWRSVAGGNTALARVIGFMAWSKWLALGAAVLGIAVWLARHRREEMRPAGAVGPSSALRGQILVAGFIVLVLLGLQGDLGRQIDDVLVRSADAVVPALVAVVLMLTTCAALYVGGSACLHAYEQEPTITPVSTRLLRRVGWAAAVAFAVAGIAALLGATATAKALAVLGVALGAWLALSWPMSVRTFVPAAPASAETDPDDEGPDDAGDTPPTTGGGEGEEPPVTGTRILLTVIAATPAVALYLAAVGAAASQWTGSGAPWFLVVLAILTLLLAGGVVWVGLTAPDLDTHDWAARELRLPVAAAVVGLVLLALVPVGVWMAAGVPAVVFLFTTVLAMVVALLVLASDVLAPRGALALVGLRRMPLVTMLVLWGVLASLLDTDGAHYDARVLSGDAAAVAVDPGEAFKAWLAFQEDELGAAGTDGRPVRPLVFVASAGGGIRAAYWSAKTWDCVFGRACGNAESHTGDVFFASGVSGGAVGLAQVRAHQLDEGDLAASGGASTDPATSWVDASLSEDFLAPAAAAFTFRDIPNSVLRLPFGGDRATALEEALESAQPNLSEDFTGPSGAFPRLAFSGTSVEDGCRLSISPVSQGGTDAVCTGPDVALPAGGPGSAPARDAVDYVCDPDGKAGSLRLSTAAVLSARFPVVSPSGGLGPCVEDGPSTYSLDGGLFDNSGGSAVAAVWNAVAGDVATTNGGTGICVVPRLLVIDSHYASEAATDPAARPQQTIAPLGAMFNVYGQRDSRELARAARLIDAAAATAAADCGDETLAEDAVVQIYPRAGTAPQPPLGWTLAESTRQNLTEQLVKGCAVEADSASTGAAAPPTEPGNNCAVIQQVRGWFEPPVTTAG